MQKASTCIECGGSPTNHHVAYFTVMMDDVARPLFSPGPMMRAVQRAAHKVTGPLAPRLMELCIPTRIARRIDEPDEFTPLLAQMLWQEAKARGIVMYEWRLFNLPRNLYVATFPDGRKISFEGIPFINNGIDRVWWMDDKAVLKKKFRKLGLPVAKGGAYFALQAALRAYEQLGAPVIVKPHSGSASRHTTLHIDSMSKLARAFYVAKEVAPFAVVEEELQGPVYRATVVNGTFVALLRRDPPHVVGNGRSTVQKLVEKENENPKRGGPYFSKIQLDDAALRELAWQGLTPDSKPKEGQRVTLHQKVNWSVGGTTADVTDGVHPDNIALWERAAEVLRASIVGTDFIMQDPTRSWKEQEKCGFLECNSMPFFDNHHLPFEGEPRNVAAKIWEMNGG
jgi:D-alanine-D-alanine ligase-like ATP-grasp enzyme